MATSLKLRLILPQLALTTWLLLCWPLLAQAPVSSPEQAFRTFIDSAKAQPALAEKYREPADKVFNKALQAASAQIAQAQDAASAQIAANNYQEALNRLIAVWEAMNGPNAPTARLLFPGSSYSLQNNKLTELMVKASLPLAESLRQQGNFQKAQQTIEGTLRLDSNNMHAQMILAQVMADQNNRGRAIQIWEQVYNRTIGDANNTDINLQAKKNIEALKSKPSVAVATPNNDVAAATPEGRTPLTAEQIAEQAKNTIASGEQALKENTEKIKRLDASTITNKILMYIQSPNFISMAILVLSVIIGYWVIWYYVMKLLVKMGMIRASIWLPHVKKYGFIAFLVFALSNIKFEKKVKIDRKLCPKCKKPIDEIESYGNLNFYACPFCNETIKPIFHLDNYIERLTENVQSIASATRGDSPLESDAMTKLVRGILTKASRERATDLHVESTMDGVTIRARRDGMLGEFLHFNKNAGTPFLNALMIQAQLDITQHMIPQDGKISAWIDGADLDIRLNSAPGPYGSNITMRLLDRRRIQVDSTQLGLESRNLELFERSIRHAHGLILVTGPSGSGKSTTLYVALNTLNNGDRSIITIEDPIEYQLPGLKQMQVNVAQHFTFATGLRSILRQDPDVIMVGEIRDKETAEIALDAAITGHLVFTTLHTIDSASAITRLRDLGIEPRRYAEALDLVVAQRLVRINCSNCKKTYKPPQKELDELKIVMTKDQLFYRGAGCEECSHTGFYGRTGLFETLEPTAAIREVLETNVSAAVIRELARKNGMQTLREEGVLRVLQGRSTTDEILRVTQ